MRLRFTAGETPLSSGQGGTHSFEMSRSNLGRFLLSLSFKHHQNSLNISQQESLTNSNKSNPASSPWRELMSCVNCNLSTCRGHGYI